MDVIDAIKARRSIRSYKDKEVKTDLIAELLEAGSYAPSSGNLQNWKIVVVRDPAKKQSLAEACLKQNWMAQAPVIFIVCNDKSDIERMYGERGKNIYSIQNCAALIQNILLAATEKGLASCWIGAFDNEEVKKILFIPDGINPEAIITLGYSDDKPEFSRFGIEKITFFEKWDKKMAFKAPMQKLKQTTDKGKSFFGKIKDKFKKKE